MIRFRKEQIGEVIERLYDSEINARIDWFWDAGYSPNLGDNLNGWPDAPLPEKIDTYDIAQSISALAWQARQIYPDSEFSKWYDELESFIEIEMAAQHGELVFYPENASVSSGVLSFEVDA